MTDTSKIGPDHYRYSTVMDPRGVHISCQRFIVVGETEYFYYVVSAAYHGYLRHLSNDAHRKSAMERNRRRVSKGGVRRYCYPCKRAALESFVARQKSRMHHAQLNMSAARISLAEAERMLEAGHIPGDGAHPCGSDEYIESLVWE